MAHEGDAMLDPYADEPAYQYGHTAAILAELARQELAEEIALYEEALRVARDELNGHAVRVAHATQDEREAIRVVIAEGGDLVVQGRRIA